MTVTKLCLCDECGERKANKVIGLSVPHTDEDRTYLCDGCFEKRNEDIKRMQQEIDARANMRVYPNMRRVPSLDEF